MGGRGDALEEKELQRRLGRGLEEVAKAVAGGCCRLLMPLRLALGVRGTVAGRPGLGGGGAYLLPFECIPWGGGGSLSQREREREREREKDRAAAPPLPPPPLPPHAPNTCSSASSTTADTSGLSASSRGSGRAGSPTPKARSGRSGTGTWGGTWGTAGPQRSSGSLSGSPSAVRTGNNRQVWQGTALGNQRRRLWPGLPGPWERRDAFSAAGLAALEGAAAVAASLVVDREGLCSVDGVACGRVGRRHRGGGGGRSDSKS